MASLIWPWRRRRTSAGGRHSANPVRAEAARHRYATKTAREWAEWSTQPYRVADVHRWAESGRPSGRPSCDA